MSDSKKDPKKSPAKTTTRKRADGARRLEEGASARPRLRASHSDAGARRRKDGPPGLTSSRGPAPSRGARKPGAPRSIPPPPTRARTETRAASKPRPSVATPRAKEIALLIAEAGLDKKALGVEIIDVAGRVEYADYLVLMTGRSDRHVQSIASGIDEALSRRSTPPLSIEGMQAGTWVLLDFSEVVAHVFQEEARRVYDIEGLWMDEGRLALPQS